MFTNYKEKYGFVYIWRDRKHKRYYIGCHWGNINDKYICSSDWMKKAYKRRPNDFKRRILSYTLDRATMLEEEVRWLNMIDDCELGKKYYNLHNSKRYPVWMLDDYKRQTVSEKIANTLREKHKNDPEFHARLEEIRINRDMSWLTPEHEAKRVKAYIESRLISSPLETRRAATVVSKDSLEYREKLSKGVKQAFDNNPDIILNRTKARNNKTIEANKDIIYDTTKSFTSSTYKQRDFIIEDVLYNNYAVAANDIHLPPEGIRHRIDSLSFLYKDWQWVEKLPNFNIELFTDKRIEKPKIICSEAARIKNSQSQMGKKLSKDTIDKIKNTRQLNRKNSPYQFKVNDLYFHTCTEAAETYNVSIQTIINRLNSPKEKYKDYQWINTE